MVSFDVVSLFTNIPRELVYDAIEKEWNNIASFTSISFSLFNETIALIMNSGFFKYRGCFYEQVEGMPMDNCLSPVVADLVMDQIIKIALERLPSTPKVITKHVDDLFLILKRDELENTLDIFNSVHDRIKFTCEKENGDQLPYLDTLVKRNSNGTISTNWYKKTIASGRFLNFFSAHPMSQKLNTAQGFVHRVKNLTTNIEFDVKNTITNILKQNNYPKQLIGKLINESVNKSIIRPDDLAPGTQTRFCSLTYVPGLSERLKKTVRRMCPDIKLCFKIHNTAGRLYPQTER
uniref:Uncharacterized protein n=1 Tax=Phlebotomus papatasi TaxID=29031 RepID=A0A1B0DR09_PHLPP